MPRPRLSLASLRAFAPSRSLSTHSHVPLASDSYAPSSGPPSGGPVVILHGLYGSKQNWRSLAKGMAGRLGREVIALDLRNHGVSPHAAAAAYLDMAGDVEHFMETRGLEDVTVIGHSMGGKVAMTLALSDPSTLSRMIVVDMAPGVGKISPEFHNYINAMKEIEKAAVHSRKEADEILTKYEPDLGIRQFLLTNLERTDPAGPYEFRLPLEILSNALGEIGEFPYAPGEKVWNKPALFLKGSRSKYINRRNIPLIEQYFPKMELKVLEAGHWVHAEQPQEFMDLVAEFCKAK